MNPAAGSGLPPATERAAVPVYRALIEAEEIAAATAVMEGGWLGMGRAVGAFEAAVHAAIDGGDRHVVAVATGGAALHLAMITAGVGAGDEVLVPSFTHLADVQAVIATGASPVFVDIDGESHGIDFDHAAALVGPATRAVLVMDYGCHISDHAAATALADRHGLRVIHDAAHSLGSFYRGAPIGSFSDIAMFSFDPVKCLSAIDGGVVVVRSPEERRRLERLRILGSDQPAQTMYQNARTWDYDTVDIGFRYHLSNVHAAVGLAQLAKLDRIRANRQSACWRYEERLRKTPGVFIPDCNFDDLCPFLYYVRVEPEHRDRLRAYLAAAGVHTGVHWRPAHLHSAFCSFRRGPLPETERAGAEIISLPLHSSAMPDEMLDRVCDGIRAYFATFRRPSARYSDSDADHRLYSR